MNKLIIMLLFFIPSLGLSECKNDVFIINSCNHKICQYISSCENQKKITIYCKANGRKCPSLEECKKNNLEKEERYVMADELSRFFSEDKLRPNDELLALFKKFSSVETLETKSVDENTLIGNSEEDLMALPPVAALVQRGMVWARVMGPVYAREAWRSIRKKVQDKAMKEGMNLVKEWAKEQEKLAQERVQERQRRNEELRQQELQGQRDRQAYFQELMKDREIKDLERGYSQKMFEALERNRRANGEPVNLEQLRQEMNQLNQNYQQDVNAHEKQKADRREQQRREEQQRQARQQEQQRKEEARQEQRRQQEAQELAERAADRAQQRAQERQERREAQQRENRQREERAQRAAQQKAERKAQERADRQREQLQREAREKAEREQKEMEEFAQRLGKPALPPWLDLYEIFESPTIEDGIPHEKWTLS